MHLGFAIPMLIGTTAGCVSFIVALLFSPETRGKQLVPDVVLALSRRYPNRASRGLTAA
jgi:hypothetical protein